MKNFWAKLPQPFFALAPMEDVTDTVFRQMVMGFGRPDVCFTEFTNVDGICHYLSSRAESRDPSIPLRFSRDDMQKPVLQRLVFDQSERPIVAQIWGKDPDKFLQAAKIVAEMGFDGIDINMACPVRAVLKIGCGGALIGQNSNVAEIVAAVKEGAPDLPISIKTRIGFKKPEIEDWLGFLLTLDLQALTIHGRTVAQKSDFPANWEEIGRAVRLRDLQLSSRAGSKDPFRSGKKGEVLRDSSTRSDELGQNDNSKKTLIVGNGDVKSLEEAAEKVRQYGVDGVMIGRGIFENPALFDKQGRRLTSREIFAALEKHIDLFEKTWGKHKHFQILKKFVKTYIQGFDGAGAIREKLMGANSLMELTTGLTGVIADFTSEF